MECGMREEETQGLLTTEKNAIRIQTDRTKKNTSSVNGGDSCLDYGTIQNGVQASGGDRNHRPPKLDRKSSRHIRVSSLGAFRLMAPPVVIPEGLPKSYSASEDGKPSYLTTVELGRQELYSQVPFTAVFGLQAKEREIREAFSLYAATLNVNDKHPEWSERQKKHRRQETKTLISKELEQVDTPRIQKFTVSFVLAVLVATASQFCVGYNTGVMNAPEKVVFPGHSTGLWSLAVAAFAVGGPLGAIAGGKSADSRGRRGALLWDISIFFFGGLLQTMASNLYIIVFARFLIGFASGASSVLVPIYLGELAPPRLRGALGTLTQFALVIGIFVANLLAFRWATESQWRFLFAVTPLVAIFQLVASPWLLESPRWLLNHDPKSKRARTIIQQLRGIPARPYADYADESVDKELENEIANYIVGEAAQHMDEQKSQYRVLREMIVHPKIRLFLTSSLVLQVSQQFSGINAVFYYSTSFFEGILDNPLVGTTIVGGVNVLATCVAVLLMDSTGRKTLLLWSSGGMFASCVVIILSLLGYLSNLMALVAVNAYVLFFEIGLGPIPWLIVAEMFEGKYVASAMSLCCQLNWACNFVVGLVFPYLSEHLGAFSFGPFAIVLAFAFWYSLLVLPETHGTTPEALVIDMVRRNSESFVFEPGKEVSETLRSSTINSEWKRAMGEIYSEEEQSMRNGTFDYGFQKIEASQMRLDITVAKRHPRDRLGISLILRSGNLCVDKISPQGLFADTELRTGDVVESINGVNFSNNPSSEEALSVVKGASSSVTITVRKRKRT